MTTLTERPAATTTVAANDTATATPTGYFYRAVWRWHFYAGLFVIPFMLMLAITGGIYLFKPQLDALMYPQHVQANGSARPYTQQLDAARAAYPGATVSSFTPAPAPDRSAAIKLTTTDARELTVFVNPYTAQVLGERDEQNNLQYYAVTMHGELLLGDTGDRIVELAACWGIVMMVTGVYLWWPRSGGFLWGTLLPRLRTKNRRIFWRDLHAVPGFWGVLVVLFMLLTGLPWTGFWGPLFTNVAGDFPAAMWNDVPQSTKLTGDLNTTANKAVPWAVEQLPMPASGAHNGHEHSGDTSDSAHTQHTKPMAGIPTGTTVNLDSVVALAQTQGVAPGFSVSLPGDETGVYTVSIFPDDPTQEATLHIDQYSGQVLADVRWSDYGLAPKAVEMGIAIHEGKYFGLANQLLMLGACLLVVLLSVSGTVLWWRRRPAGTLGAPALPPMPVWKTAVAITVVLAIVFPLMGASLVAVLLLDKLATTLRLKAVAA